jgi:predicted Zn finger-like uncharacterized protein
MDVTCNRCGTIYEFDAGLIAPSGTTVKCTECGHLFKVHRPSPLPVPSEDAAAKVRSWRVRKADGSAHVLESLAELIRLIGTGQFGPEDEISRTGQVWKRLGSIAELASLFEPSPRARRRTDPPPATSSEPPAAELRARRRSPLDQSLVPNSDVDDSIGRARRPSPVLELGRPRRPAVTDPPSAPAEPAIQPAARSADVSDLASPQATPVLSAVVQPRVSRNYLGMLSIVGALLITGSVAAVVFGPGRDGAVSNERTREMIARGDRALATHQPTGFESALREYEAALAIDPRDARLLSSISRTHAVWGQWLRTRMSELDESGAAGSDEAFALKVISSRHATDAKRYAERAVQLDPRSGDAGVAWSDALRLAGDLGAAKAALERARTDGATSQAETLRVAALLAIDEAAGDSKAGRSLAEQAVAAEPSLLRARFLLLHCLIEAGALDAARVQLQALRQLDPAHPDLPAMRARIAAAQQRHGHNREAGQGKPRSNAPSQPTGSNNHGGSRQAPQLSIA